VRFLSWPFTRGSRACAPRSATPIAARAWLVLLLARFAGLLFSVGRQTLSLLKTTLPQKWSGKKRGQRRDDRSLDDPVHAFTPRDRAVVFAFGHPVSLTAYAFLHPLATTILWLAYRDTHGVNVGPTTGQETA
jgi:hypothetical protein